MKVNNHGSTLHLDTSTSGDHGLVVFSRLIINSNMTISSHMLRFRYLISKAIQFESGITDDEHCEMFKLYDLLLEIRIKSFYRKYGYFLSEIRYFIKYVITNKKQFGQRAALSIDRLVVDQLFDERALYGLYHDKTFNVSHIKLIYDNLTKRRYPVAYIGVGYKDKGSCKDYSFDGSPSWQEISLDENHRVLDNLKLRGPPEIIPFNGIL